MNTFNKLKICNKLKDTFIKSYGKYFSKVKILMPQPTESITEGEVSKYKISKPVK